MTPSTTDQTSSPAGSGVGDTPVPEHAMSNIETLKEAIRRIDGLVLGPIWPKEAHYFSGVCKAGCITELRSMIAEMEGQHIIGGSAYTTRGNDNGR